MNTLLKNIYLGSDPEFFLAQRNEIFPAYLFVGDDKNAILSKDGRNKMYHDNILLEYTTTPSNSIDSWMHNQISMIKELKSIVTKHGYQLVAGVEAEVPNEHLGDDRAHSFGCNPVLNVYDKDREETPLNAPFKTRYAGGHVHIAYPDENIEQSILILKLLDLYLGLPSILIEPFNSRRIYYGKAGSFRREESFKIEYRTLSNFWLYHDNYISWVYNTVTKVVQDVLSGNNIELSEEDSNSIRKSIDTCDTITAVKLCNKFNVKILKHEKNIRLWHLDERVRKSLSPRRSKDARKRPNVRKTHLKGWRDSVSS